MPVSQISDADLFAVDLLGIPVECATLEDAVAVKAADDILLRNDPTPYQLDAILPYVRVLGRYGRHTEAQQLRAMFR